LTLTSAQYKAEIKKMGLTPAKPSYDGATIHRTAAGDHVSVPDPDTLEPEQRPIAIAVIKSRLMLF